ncbi:response regulator [Photobacterium kagoshimensis]|uniref:response regulator n=1 Tax=Photobacterium kagoshimensis TaxID=2910242 RepID=UPI003D1414DF
MEQVLLQRRFQLTYSAIQSIRHLFTDKAAALEIEATRLQQLQLVCSEYCTNLLKHQAQATHSILISYGKCQQGHYLAIQDNGQPWKQLKTALCNAQFPTTLSESGMGLAIIKATFPDFDYQTTTTGNQLRFYLSNKKQKQQLLIVDDSQSQLKLLAHFLEDNYQLTIFSQATEAIEWLAHNHCDLVLTDFHMPIMSGITFRDHVKQQRRHATLPFVFISGDTLADSIAQAGQSAIDDYLLKPINKPHLLGVIQRVLERHQHLTTQYQLQFEQQLALCLPLANTQAEENHWHIQINQQAESSGDFVMQRSLADGTTLVILGDHMGHGAIAKANGAVWQGYISGLLENNDITPAQLFLLLNTKLCQSQSHHLLCLQLIHLQKGGRAEYLNAGMPAPLCFIEERSEQLQHASGLLGLFDEIDVEPWQGTFQPGMSIHCYSDGLAESHWSVQALNQLKYLSPEQRHQQLWRYNAPMTVDDKTLVTISYRNPTCHQDSVS